MDMQEERHLGAARRASASRGVECVRKRRILRPICAPSRRTQVHARDGGVDMGVDTAAPHQGQQLPHGLLNACRDSAEDGERSSDWGGTVSDRTTTILD